MSSQTGLKNLRKKIDDIDDRLLDLLNERSQIALKISKQKKRGSHEVYDPVREKEIEIKLKKNNRGPFPTDSIISVFREIISACRSLQNPVKVAYLGPEGSFSHQAAYKKFGSSSELLPQRSFEEIFEEIDTERATFGIVPLENSEEGSVGAVLDLLSTFSLSVCSEYYEKINHYLLSKSTKKSDVRIVASHPQALAQSRRWLQKNMKDVEFRETSSTAQAAKIASRSKKIAAVAGKHAASIYKLNVLAKNIEQRSGNITRFLVVGKFQEKPSGNDKTSIVFSLRDTPGALESTLFLPFSKSKINLTKIESRPSKDRPWEYLFFVDFLGHRNNPTVKSVLNKVRARCISLKILGSYPVTR